jgi:hypothetical protein
VSHAGLEAGLNVPDPIAGGRLKLDIIGFDACLMAMYEVGSTLAPYGHHLLASELLEPGHGWDYAALAGITQRETAAGTPVSSLSALDVGNLFIKDYFDQVQQQSVPSHGLQLPASTAACITPMCGFQLLLAGC